MSTERNETARDLNLFEDQTDFFEDHKRAVASSTMVNRTHRIVRERAKAVKARRSRARSLWIPLAISAGLLAAVVCAIWTGLQEYEVAPAGLPDASQQIFVLLMWCVPISLAAFAVILFRRAGSEAGNGGTR